MPSGTCSRCGRLLENGVTTCPKCSSSVVPPHRESGQKPLAAPQTASSERNASGSGSGSDGNDSDSSEDSILPHATAFAACQPGETLTAPPFSRGKDQDWSMIEHPPGSNEWYQAYYLQESLTEYRIRFPATRKTKEDRVEWIDKRSSRIWRGENGGKYWRYIKKSEGMWIPKTQEELAGKGKKGKGVSAGGGKQSRGAGKKGKGKGQQRGSKQSTVEDSDSESDTRAELAPLAAWFEKHVAVLSGRALPGSAEGGSLQAAKKRPKTDRSTSSKGAHRTATSSSFAASDSDGGSSSSGEGAGEHGKPTTVGGGAQRTNKPRHDTTTKEPPLAVRRTASAPIPPVAIRSKPIRPPVLLEEDDLFGGRTAPAAPKAPPLMSPTPGPSTDGQASGQHAKETKRPPAPSRLGLDSHTAVGAVPPPSPLAGALHITAQQQGQGRPGDGAQVAESGGSTLVEGWSGMDVESAKGEGGGNPKRKFLK